MGKTVDIQALNSFILNEVIKKPKESSKTVQRCHKTARTHFLNLVKNITNVSNGQATLITKDDKLTEFQIQIIPLEGPYAGKTINFDFKLPTKYPIASPIINCISELFHPNIDDDGEICLSLLDDWCQESNDLLDCVQGLLFLLYYPNFDDPLNPNFAPGEYTLDEFQECVQQWYEGKYS